MVLVLSSCNYGNKKTQFHNPKIVEESLIDSIWAANGVRFDLKTVDDRQFVAYFDRNRMMTLASRYLSGAEWTKKTLDNQLIWDSHNSVVLGIDKAGHIHVSGNMHAQPMVYFRSQRPFDVNSMEPFHKMVGQEESRVTYPSFFNDKNEELYYTYRIGGSGNGNIIVNHYVTERREWERYLDTPLFEGISEHENRSAYHKRITDGQGNFHFVWMWRWTPNVETCHNLCYAKTADLKHWENAAGETISLPLKPEDQSLFVDPVPSKAILL